MESGTNKLPANTACMQAAVVTAAVVAGQPGNPVKCRDGGGLLQHALAGHKALHGGNRWQEGTRWPTAEVMLSMDTKNKFRYN